MVRWLLLLPREITVMLSHRDQRLDIVRHLNLKETGIRKGLIRSYILRRNVNESPRTRISLTGPFPEALFYGRMWETKDK